MAQWKLTLSYDGTGFHGWQVQPDRVTVQGTLSRALLHVTGEKVLPQGSGRTDAGVHALGQVASVALVVPIPAANLQRALNAFLPASIRILAAEQVPDTFHARRSALRKSYEYRIFERRASNGSPNVCPPFLAPYLWDCPWHLDLAAIDDATGRIVGEHDFSSFAASDPDRTARDLDISPSNVRTVLSAAWTRSPETLIFRITGSGFLHHMVRNLVGTFIDVGRGALTPDDLGRILSARDRTAAGPTAPARGLFLVSVEYPDILAAAEPTA